MENNDQSPVESLKIVDTSGSLTLDELKELKKLASLSKTTRVLVGIAFAVIGLLGLPTVMEWLSKHINW